MQSLRRDVQEIEALGTNGDSTILIAPLRRDTDRQFNMDGIPQPLIRFRMTDSASLISTALGDAMTKSFLVVFFFHYGNFSVLTM